MAANIKDRELVRDRRRQLVEAALAVFLRKGYHDTTVREIGREAGFTQGTIYNYVRSKGDILYLVCDEVVRAYQDAVARAVEGVTDPGSRLSGAVRAVAEELYDHQDAILLMFQESHALDRRSLKNILERVSEYIEMFERLLGEAAQDRRIPPVHGRLAANIVTFLPTMLALRRWDLRRRMSREAMLDGVTAFLLRGLGASDRPVVPARRRRTNGSGRPCPTTTCSTRSATRWRGSPSTAPSSTTPSPATR